MKKVYLMGIGGIGMTALAGLFKAKGFDVCGSDQKVYSPAKEELARLGVSYFEGYNASNITSDIDLVVIGNVISKGHVEAVAVMEKGLAYTSMAQALGQYFLNDRETIVVTGTHGKTTTTTLISFVLSQLKHDPGYFIGGLPLDLEFSYALGKKPYFVLEGDEYDSAYFEKTPKFLHLKPHHVLINAIEFDHADIYQNIDQIKREFSKLIELKNPKGVLVVNMDDAGAKSVIQGASIKHHAYSLKNEDMFHARNIVYVEDGMRFDVYEKNVFLVHVKTGLIGTHSIYNVLACLCLCRALGFDLEVCAKAVSKFRGVRRRQELIGCKAGVRVYDDFAHHPSAVAYTLDGFKHLTTKPGRLIAIFEPRSNTSRRKIFQSEWPNAFLKADQVLFAPVFKKSDQLQSSDELDLSEVVDDLKSQNVRASIAKDDQAILTELLTTLKEGDVCVFMSNGAFGNLPRRLFEALR